jgi:hypothetical protein
MKFKVAATTGLSLSLDPMGKMFQNASSLKPLEQLKPNCPGMIIGRSSINFLFFYDDRKSKMAATAGHRLTLDPMGKCSNAFFSETTNRWWPSWISDRNKKQKICRGPSNDHSWAVWFQLSKWIQRRSVLKHFSP